MGWPYTEIAPGKKVKSAHILMILDGWLGDMNANGHVLLGVCALSGTFVLDANHGGLGISTSATGPGFLQQESLGGPIVVATVPVTSVFGRTGGVSAASGDYNAAQVTNAVSTARNISTGTGLTGGGNLSADRTLSVVDNSTTQRIEVASGGNLVGTRKRLNLIAGSFVAVSATDNSGSDRVDVTIHASGAVTSVFGRTGAVSAASGDYTVGQVTNAVPDSRQVIAGTGLSGGGALTGDVTLSVSGNSTIQKVEVRKNSTGSAIGTRKRLNFIEGENIVLTIVDDNAADEVDIRIASGVSGASGSGILVVEETPSGTINGVNDTFTITTDPAYVQIFSNGRKLKEGTGFTRSGTTITFLSGYIPDGNDVLEAVLWS